MRPRTFSGKFAARLEAVIWILIYGGLLTLILGFWVEPMDDDTGWPLRVGGALAAIIGFALIYVRSRIKGSIPDFHGIAKFNHPSRRRPHDPHHPAIV